MSGVALVVNGEPQVLEDVSSVDDLITALGLDRRGLAVAVDGEVVPRSLWGEWTVGEGTQVEILTIAQGG